MSSESYYIGVDVGTGSVRSGLVKPDGTIAAISTEATQTFRDSKDHRIFEQSTTDIWNGIGKTIRAVLAEAKVSPSQVKGIGFDATCSLAGTDMNGDPVVVTGGGDIGQSLAGRLPSPLLMTYLKTGVDGSDDVFEAQNPEDSGVLLSLYVL